ncbi:hypothetical protein V8C26DRAFT_361655 [Trichoderma gracile]
MTSAQSMEEELQQSVMLSDEDAGFETADSAGEDAHSLGVSKNGITSMDFAETGTGGNDGMEMDEDDDELSDRDASGEEIDEEMDQDAEGEEYTELVDQQIVVSNGHHLQRNNDDEEDEDDDEEGDEDGDEGVGAVKIKPGDTDEEDDDEDDEDADDDAESDVSDLLSVAEDDSDEEPAWEEAGGVEEDDESETAPSNICIFCRQDEENDPSEDFEAFLTCIRCNDNAHQQCARDAAAMSEQNNAKRWKCPECDNGDSDREEPEEREGGASIDGEARNESQLSDAPVDASLARRVQDGVEAGGDQTTHAEASGEPRMLRKRKTSSAEPEEATVTLRRRRRGLSTDATSANEDTDSRSAEQARGSSRAVRLKISRPSLVTVDKKLPASLILTMRVRPGNLKEILSRRRRERRRSGTSGRRPRTPVASSAARRNSTAVTATPTVLQTPFTTDFYSTPFYSLFDKETEDMKGKPYGGILTEAEADTSKTLPQPEDRKRFDQAKQRAEDEWRARVLQMQAEVDVPVRKSKKSSDNASQIECIEFGGWEIDTWYAAPYPAEYSRNRVLYICEFCLKYMNSDYVAWRHKLKCGAKHPPGDEIYRHGSVSVFEVDGRKNPVYCQNLCLLAKLFLGSKTLYYDVEPFLFYVLCEYDDCGYHFVGYFSKEKRASSQNNVSCILTLPIHQRKGYGNLLIDFSYLLTKVEEKTGSPEKPLSDMGLVSYRNYWRLRLCRYFIETMKDDQHKQTGLSIRQISDDTGMTPDDVIAALEGLRALVRDPQTKVYAFRIDLEYCRQYVAKWESKGYVQLKPEALAWTPYVMGRSNAVNFELGPPINTIAPREDDEAKLEEGVNGISGGGHSMMMNGDLNEDSQPRVGSASEMGDSANGHPGFTPLLSIENKTAPEDKENAEPRDEAMDDVQSQPDWMLPYRDIPPSRFEVFPPVAGGRRADRSRQSVSRPLAPRTGATSSSRPRPKRAGGSSRRPTASRPRSSGTRRKTGGTGRGPGRWPKGTKKSDYGNADSGPGLPPGWRDKIPHAADKGTDGDRSVTASMGEEEPAKDEVRVMTPQPSSNGFAHGVQLGGQAIERSGSRGVNGRGADGEVEEEEEELDVDAEGEDE